MPQRRNHRLKIPVAAFKIVGLQQLRHFELTLISQRKSPPNLGTLNSGPDWGWGGEPEGTNPGHII
jgi:hypothetical protein